jgi:hypothetical protein
LVLKEAAMLAGREEGLRFPGSLKLRKFPGFLKLRKSACGCVLSLVQVGDLRVRSQENRLQAWAPTFKVLVLSVLVVRQEEVSVQEVEIQYDFLWETKKRSDNR